MSLLDNLTPGPFRTPLSHDEWIEALRVKYDGTGIGVLDDGTLINLHTAAPVADVQESDADLLAALYEALEDDSHDGFYVWTPGTPLA